MSFFSASEFRDREAEKREEFDDFSWNEKNAAIREKKTKIRNKN